MRPSNDDLGTLFGGNGNGGGELFGQDPPVQGPPLPPGIDRDSPEVRGVPDDDYPIEVYGPELPSGGLPPARVVSRSQILPWAIAGVAVLIMLGAVARSTK